VRNLLVDAAAERTIRRVAEPSAPLFVVNPEAGNGRGRRIVPWLSGELRRRSPSAGLVETEAAGHAFVLARDAARSGFDRVVVVGGDGTAQDALNGLLDSGASLPLALLPRGSGNDLARGVGLPLLPSEALSVALGTGRARIDVGRATRTDATGVTVRHFAAAGGVGFDAQVAAVMAGRRRAWQRGRIGYALSTIWELQRYHNLDVSLRFDTEHGPRAEERRVLFVAIANGAYYGGGMRICPAASVTDGWLDVCLVGDLSRLEALRQLPGLYRGAHATHRAVEFVRVRSLEISGTLTTRIHLDGEPFGTLPVRVEVLPLALEIVVPSQAAQAAKVAADA
jgi:diacylglycerol kinase (ATP)